jgi:hypothetical protein
MPQSRQDARIESLGRTTARRLPGIDIQDARGCRTTYTHYDNGNTIAEQTTEGTTYYH